MALQCSAAETDHLHLPSTSGATGCNSKRVFTRSARKLLEKGVFHDSLRLDDNQQAIPRKRVTWGSTSSSSSKTQRGKVPKQNPGPSILKDDFRKDTSKTDVMLSKDKDDLVNVPNSSKANVASGKGKGKSKGKGRKGKDKSSSGSKQPNATITYDTISLMDDEDTVAAIFPDEDIQRIKNLLLTYKDEVNRLDFVSSIIADNLDSPFPGGMSKKRLDDNMFYDVLSITTTLPDVPYNYVVALVESLPPMIDRVKKVIQVLRDEIMEQEKHDKNDIIIIPNSDGHDPLASTFPQADANDTQGLTMNDTNKRIDYVEVVLVDVLDQSSQAKDKTGDNIEQMQIASNAVCGDSVEENGSKASVSVLDQNQMTSNETIGTNLSGTLTLLKANNKRLDKVEVLLDVLDQSSRAKDKSEDNVGQMQVTSSAVCGDNGGENGSKTSVSVLNQNASSERINSTDIIPLVKNAENMPVPETQPAQETLGKEKPTPLQPEFDIYLTMEALVDKFPMPEMMFSDEDREVSKRYKKQVIFPLQITFPLMETDYLQAALRRHNHLLYPAYKEIVADENVSHLLMRPKDVDITMTLFSHEPDETLYNEWWYLMNKHWRE